MNSVKILSILLVVMTIIVTHSATASGSEFLGDVENGDASEIPALERGESPSFSRGTGLILVEKPRVVMTCNKYPTVCRAKGSSGPDCCNKQCVNVMTDSLNCGSCGKKCGYSEMCCQGSCVNPFTDKNHCGRCNHGCMKGSSCVYGLCSYA